MKKWLQCYAIIFTVLAILVTILSNTDIGRNIYKTIFTRQLGRGINRLFSHPSKYKNPKVPEEQGQDYDGSLNYFPLQPGKDAGFEEVKKIIMANYYKKKLDYEVRFIVQYQAEHRGSDAVNPVFNKKMIFFLPKTEKNKNVNFLDAPDAMVTGAIPITYQDRLTENLDTFFTNRIVVIASLLLVIAAVLDFKVWKMEDRK